MKGDYHRYLAEFATANERKDAAENSLVAYKAASDVALTELPTTHPIRLGLHYHICHTDVSLLKQIGCSDWVLSQIENMCNSYP